MTNCVTPRYHSTLKTPWMDFARQMPHTSNVTNKRRLRRPKESAGALDRWEGEGGAPQPKSERNREARAALAKEEEHALRCLGAAVIMHWNDLPTKIQRDLFDHAISMGEPRYTAQLKERIARFLHRHKNDEFGKIPTPPVVKART